MPSVRFNVPDELAEDLAPLKKNKKLTLFVSLAVRAYLSSSQGRADMLALSGQSVPYTSDLARCGVEKEVDGSGNGRTPTVVLRQEDDQGSSLELRAASSVKTGAESSNTVAKFYSGKKTP